jgi:hypothetical protein
MTSRQPDQRDNHAVAGESCRVQQHIGSISPPRSPIGSVILETLIRLPGQRQFRVDYTRQVARPYCPIAQPTRESTMWRRDHRRVGAQSHRQGASADDVPKVQETMIGPKILDVRPLLGGTFACTGVAHH